MNCIAGVMLVGCAIVDGCKAAVGFAVDCGRVVAKHRRRIGAVCVTGGGLWIASSATRAYADGPTPTDYTTSFDTFFTVLNFSGSSTSLLNSLTTKTTPLFIAVMTACVLVAIIWRLGMKSKKVAG